MSLWTNLLPWKQRDAQLRDRSSPADYQADAAKPAPTEQPVRPRRRVILTGRHAIRGVGALTGSDLGRLRALTLPHRPDPFGRPGPQPTGEALRLSLELAQMTYTLDITPWMRAGWTDFSFQIDDVLESDPLAAHGSRVSTAQDESFQRLAQLHRMRRAQAALRARNPLVQVMAALRQREGSDTVKAVCMMHPLPGDRYLLAIGFMGTGRRFYDWFSNFRLTAEGGFHQGFLQLCRHFEQAADSIFFPDTARRLGLDRLTLADVLRELRNPDSRFRLWMAGHSQGSAVMQVYAHRLIHEQGVDARHMAGFGFASPTAASGSLTDTPWDYPLWHVINRDDLVPRVGAQVHLGRCLDFLPDEGFRRLAYRQPATPADQACRAWIEPFLGRIQDTADNLLHVTALALCVLEEKGEDSLNSLLDRRWHIPAMDRLLTYAGGRAQGVVQLTLEHQRRIYRELTGAEMDESRLRALMEEMRPHVAATPLRRILSVLAESLSQPHQLKEEGEDRSGAYPTIVSRYLRRLRPFCWEPRCGVPRRRYAPRPGADAARRRAVTRRGTARLGRSPAR